MTNEKRLIRLEEAKKLFDDIPPFIGMTGRCVQDMLDKLPTVDAVEVVHGKMELIEKAGCDYYCCSECGKILGGFYAKPEYNFCPNCGAKMDGGTDNE